MPTSAHTPLSKNRSEFLDHPRESTLAPITVQFTSQTCPAASLSHSLLESKHHRKKHSSGGLSGDGKAGESLRFQEINVGKPRRTGDGRREAGRVPGDRGKDKKTLYAGDK